jgi:hypothetical protein
VVIEGQEEGSKLQCKGFDSLTLLVIRVENGHFLSRSVPTVFIHYAFVPIFKNYEKLSDSINFNVILHYFVVVYFHKCRKISFRSDRFSTFMILCSTFFDYFHPYW